MLFLSIDTSGKSGGITLAKGAGSDVRVLDSSVIAGGTFSAQLIPTLAMLLQKHGLAPADIGGLVAVSGPGSFTGLRIGLTAIKGLAEVLRVPIATVSVLEALAISSGHEGRIAAALDAGRTEAYSGVYQVTGGRASTIKEEAVSQPGLVNSIKSENVQLLVTSDQTIAELASASFPVVKVDRPGSEAAARIGLAKLLAREIVGVETLDANYIRRSDAEIFAKPKAL